jgi:hypothetical protein
VVDARDHATLERAVGERPLGVGAAVGEGVPGVALAHHHEPGAVGRDRREHAVGELADGAHAVPAQSFSLTPGTPSFAWTTRSTYSATFGRVTRLITS